MRDRMLDLKGSEPAPASSTQSTPATAPKDKEKKQKQSSVTPAPAAATLHDSTDSPEMQSFFNQISAIRDQISVIQTNITTIATLHQKAMNTISEEESHRTQQEIEGVMDKTNKLTQDIRTKIKKLDEENKSMVKKPDAQSQSDARIRISQHSSLLKKFLDTVQQYKDTQQKFQDKYKQRLQRQFLIVKPNATEEEIEKVMDGKQGPIFAQEIKMTGQRREAQRALDDIQERHRDILRIEQSIIELQQLFMDMAVLVSAQGDMLNQIDIHVSNAVDYTEAGTQELTKAVKLQKKARKKMCIIIGCLVLLCLAIGLGVYFGTK